MIEVIAGTNRAGSNSLKVAHILAGIYRSFGEDVQILDLAELPREVFRPDAYKEKPAAFTPYQERVLAADGLHVVVPEYNGSFPGVLKYFVDMLKFPESFEHRCVAYTGIAAGQWGGLRAVEQLQMVFGYRSAYNLPERVWIPGVGKLLSEDGTLNDGQYHERLENQVREFLAFVERNRALATGTN